MDVKVSTLFSGSSANSTYVEVNGRGILIDVGGGVKKTQSALQNIGSSLDKIEAVFITHEHSDHISGLKTVLKHYNIPVIANARTLDAIETAIPDINSSLFRCMPTGARAVKGDFEITSISTSHDAAESVGYVIKTQRGNVGIITDLGEYNEDILSAASECNTLILESNHDLDMLWNGRYPPMLKRRVGGSHGHLSNLQAGEFLTSVCHKGIKNVILAHLSAENNLPTLALETVSSTLAKTGAVIGTAKGQGDVYITVAPRNDPSGFIVL
jgi:phosphoribosyl 1,2-cyclic phosphodiesterase